MKSFIPLILLAIGVSAQDKYCGADYIVTQCLQDESGKAQACAATDLNCLCAAYQAVATCYNNCPNDSRASGAKQQVASYCANASQYSSSSSTLRAPYPTSTAPIGVASGQWFNPTGTAPYSFAPSPTVYGGGSQISIFPTGSVAPGETNSFGFGAAPTSTGGAGEVVRSNGGMIAAVAGVAVAVML